jgi:hypothetical protein
MREALDVELDTVRDAFDYRHGIFEAAFNNALLSSEAFTFGRWRDEDVVQLYQ